MESNLKNRRSVALLYEENSIAPRVVAKGQGLVAQAIVDRAKEFNVPVAVEPELVELLVQLDLNTLIPPDLYAAVVEVLAWAYQMDGRIGEDLSIARRQRPGLR